MLRVMLQRLSTPLKIHCIVSQPKLVYQRIVIAALLHTEVLVSFPSIQIPETIKLRIRGFFRARKNSCRTCHYEESWSIMVASARGIVVQLQTDTVPRIKMFLCKTYKLPGPTSILQICALFWSSCAARWSGLIWVPGPHMFTSTSSVSNAWGTVARLRKHFTRCHVILDREGLERGCWTGNCAQAIPRHVTSRLGHICSHQHPRQVTPWEQ